MFQLVNTHALLLLWLLVGSIDRSYVHAGKIPEASSTLLRMHRMYVSQPPHDSSLYDVLEVSPNATLATIKKSYRNLSRKYHPDKQHRRRQNAKSFSTPIDPKAKYEEVTRAYNILKDDFSRLRYHRYGLTDSIDAVYLLTGRFQEAIDRNPALDELVRLMGYNLDDPPPPPPPPAEIQQSTWGDDARQKQDHFRRVNFMANTVVGTIRPVIEGSVEEQWLADIIVAQADRLKKLPMGAQIIRCIGRAYRYSGRRLLRQYHVNPAQFGIDDMERGQRKITVPLPALLGVSDRIRDQFWRADHVVKAAVAGGRVLFSGHKARRLAKAGRKDTPNSDDDATFGMEDEQEDDFTPLFDAAESGIGGFIPPEDDDVRLEERRKAQNAILESLQVEALWKIYKIQLDKTVREACDLLLEGGLFFDSNSNTQEEGWISSSGAALSLDTARVRAAAALVMVGDILVQRSKEGTAWME